MIASVCMVVHSYCPDDPRVRREAEALTATGTKVDVICLRNDGESARETVNGVRYFRLPIQRKRGGIVRYLLEYGLFFVASLFMTSWLAFQNRYDVFQAHNMPDVLVFCGLIPRLRGAKIVLDLHDLVPEVYAAKYELKEGSKALRVLCFVEAISLAAADLIITTSIAFRDRLVERGVPRQKIEIVLNSPAESIFPEEEPWTGPAGDAFHLIYHGTVVHRSGLDFAIRAVAALREEMPGLDLTICGGGDAEDDCKRLATELGVSDRVTFHGQRPIEEIPEHIRKCDLGVIPNRLNVFTERNLPTRIFEYLRMGRPVLVARTPGISDYFGEEDLLFFEPESVDGLAEAIRKAAQAPDSVRKTLERGRAVYGRYRWAEEQGHYRAVLGALPGTSDPA